MRERSDAMGSDSSPESHVPGARGCGPSAERPKYVCAASVSVASPASKLHVILDTMGECVYAHRVSQLLERSLLQLYSVVLIRLLPPSQFLYVTQKYALKHKTVI